MAQPARTIAVIADDFKLRTPAQQLLDRFLIGYPFDGKFRRSQYRVVLHLTSAATERADIMQRVKDFGLIEEQSLAEALQRADAVVVARPAGTLAPPLAVVEAMRPATKCFVYGALSNSLALANEIIDKARAKDCQILAGTATRGAIPLPVGRAPAAPKLPSEGWFPRAQFPLAKGLIIVQGAYPSAELEALEGLLPLIAHRKGADTGIKRVRFLSGPNLWPTLKRDFWRLLKSAISRSDTPQGDAVSDGRTQDLARLGLIESLAKEPRAWIIEHADAFVFAVVVLDGVLADYNFALETEAGGIISAQLYRPPPPGEHHYSNLAAALDQFFATGKPPWPLEQNLLTVELLQSFSSHWNPG